jgi:hypothetical protein
LRIARAAIVETVPCAISRQRALRNVSARSIDIDALIETPAANKFA